MDFPNGNSYDDTVKMLDSFKGMSANPEKQLTGGYHLTGLDQARGLAELALTEFMESNSIFRAAEAGVARMESEVVSMVGSLLGSRVTGRTPAAGFMTSGGTESNIVALYAMRNAAGPRRRRGNVVFPSTVHPTIWKACHVLGLEPVSVEVDEDTFAVDVEALREALTPDTIGVVATCGTIPWSTIDPIREIGRLADERSLWLHVDAAWGGLICPWLRQLGYDVPDFGFGNRGVSSISTDPHKQAFSVLPAGAIVFRDEHLLNWATWSATRAGRNYTSRGILGSRPGSTVAATWALMRFLGRTGYLDLSKRCMELTLKFVEAAGEIPGLEVPTAPKMNMASVVSTRLDMERVKKRLREGAGWFFLEANGPPMTRFNAIGVGLEPYHERVLPSFLRDLRRAAKDATARDEEKGGGGGSADRRRARASGQR